MGLLELNLWMRRKCQKLNPLCLEGTRLKFQELIEEKDERISSLEGKEVIGRHTCAATCFSGGPSMDAYEELGIYKLEREGRLLDEIMGPPPRQEKPSSRYSVRAVIIGLLNYLGLRRTSAVS